MSPETPVTIQTLQDFNQTNPFVDASDLIKKQPFPKNLAYRFLYNRLKNPTDKAARRNRQFMGQGVARFVKAQLPGFVPPTYSLTCNYARTGQTIILQADEAYYQKFPEDKSEIFNHHLLPPYLYLAERLK